jgi:hypothetical protein
MSLVATIAKALECVTMQEARIELLQRMPIFGGIHADTLQFLLAFCPIVWGGLPVVSWPGTRLRPCPHRVTPGGVTRV